MTDGVLYFGESGHHLGQVQSGVGDSDEELLHVVVASRVGHREQEHYDKQSQCVGEVSCGAHPDSYLSGESPHDRPIPDDGSCNLVVLEL